MTPSSSALASPPVAVRPGLRERKAAETRLAIVASLERRLAATDLRDITADELAGDANVSRMTFFNYFPSKRDAVDLVMVALMFRLEAGIEEKRLRGVAAIEYLFGVFGDEVAAAPHRMRRMLAHFASRAVDRPLSELTLAERMVLAPELGDRVAALTPAPTLGALLMRLVEEAQDDGALLSGSSYELAHYLGGLLNGAALVGHSTDDTDWRRLFRRHARRALGLLGVDGLADPRPPRVPRRYRKEKRAR